MPDEEPCKQGKLQLKKEANRVIRMEKQKIIYNRWGDYSMKLSMLKKDKGKIEGKLKQNNLLTGNKTHTGMIKNYI